MENFANEEIYKFQTKDKKSDFLLSLLQEQSFFNSELVLNHLESLWPLLARGLPSFCRISPIEQISNRLNLKQKLVEFHSDYSQSKITFSSSSDIDLLPISLNSISLKNYNDWAEENSSIKNKFESSDNIFHNKSILSINLSLEQCDDIKSFSFSLGGSDPWPWVNVLIDSQIVRGAKSIDYCSDLSVFKKLVYSKNQINHFESILELMNSPENFLEFTVTLDQATKCENESLLEIDILINKNIHTLLDYPDLEKILSLNSFLVANLFKANVFPIIKFYKNTEFGHRFPLRLENENHNIHSILSLKKTSNNNQNHSEKLLMINNEYKKEKMFSLISSTSSKHPNWVSIWSEIQEKEIVDFHKIYVVEANATNKRINQMHNISNLNFESNNLELSDYSFNVKTNNSKNIEPISDKKRHTLFKLSQDIIGGIDKNLLLRLIYLFEEFIGNTDFSDVLNNLRVNYELIVQQGLQIKVQNWYFTFRQCDDRRKAYVTIFILKLEFILAQRIKPYIQVKCHKEFI